MDRREENEEKKKYLKRFRALKRAEERIQEEIEVLKLDKRYPSTVSTGMPRTSGLKDYSDYAVVLEEKMEELFRKKYEKIRLYCEIEKAVDRLEDEEEKEVLMLRYIHGLTWERISERLGYGLTWIHKIHGHALENFRIPA